MQLNDWLCHWILIQTLILILSKVQVNIFMFTLYTSEMMTLKWVKWVDCALNVLSEWNEKEDHKHK